MPCVRVWDVSVIGVFVWLESVIGLCVTERSHALCADVGCDCCIYVVCL